LRQDTAVRREIRQLLGNRQRESRLSEELHDTSYPNRRKEVRNVENHQVRPANVYPGICEDSPARYEGGGSVMWLANLQDAIVYPSLNDLQRNSWRVDLSRLSGSFGNRERSVVSLWATLHM
jgi:hypothetical protein